MRNIVCRFGYSFTTNQTYIVTLASTKSGSTSAVVFSTINDGTAASVPAPRWSAPHSLRILTLSNELIGVQKTSYMGVKIVYSYRQ